MTSASDEPFARFVTPDMLAERKRNDAALDERLRAQAAALRARPASAPVPTQTRDLDVLCTDEIARQVEYKRRLAIALDDECQRSVDAQIFGISPESRAEVASYVRSELLRELRAHLARNPHLSEDEG
ncbi:hypothetical protein ND991_16325 [Gordonia sputi]|uniref:hypothetical protein n=1 Tax=Gordonia sputi TaxID=36823 RepID=UPI0020446922|nr:hypothetical protein [Gordonia sputi]MCM3896773.1 hypothetical protein [Gordonia sputi]